MKSKSTLTLLELILMVLVFSLAAALCLRAFVWSSKTAGEDHIKAEAERNCQAVAEVLKAEHGNLNESLSKLGWSIWGGRSDIPAVNFDKNWKVCDSPDGSYLLYVDVRRGTLSDPLGRADIYVTDGDNNEIYRLVSSWQEVAQ